MAWQKVFRNQSPEGNRQVVKGLVLRLLEMAVGLVPLILGWWALFAIQEGRFVASKHWPIIIIVLVTCLVVQLALSYYGQMLCFTGGYNIVVSFRRKASEHLRKLPVGFFQEKRVGELNALLTDDMKKSEDFFTHFLAELLLAVGFCLVLGMALAILDYRLAIGVVCLMPLGLLVLRRYFRQFVVLYRDQLERLSEVSARLVEFTHSIKTLRIYNRMAVLADPLVAKISDIRSSSMKIEAVGGLGILAFRMSTELGIAVMLWAASVLWLGDNIQTPSWVLFFLLSYLFVQQVVDASTFYGYSRSANPSGEKLANLMALPAFAPLLKEQEQRRQTFAQLDIALNNVSFSYPGTGKILADISLAIPAGTTTAIVGPSGCGKSTLLNLLSCFHLPDSGDITLGGVPYRDIGADRIYEQLGVVFQDSFVFDGTVADNIRLGKGNASTDDIVAACQSALCHDFITKLPQGYDTPLGEGGARLSGGERQRLAIARMMVKKPSIILADEMTAQLDPINQYHLQVALSRLSQGKTLVMVAHRLHTIMTADQILVLEKGRLVQRGSHDTLLGEDGLYRKMWSAQVDN